MATATREFETTFDGLTIEGVIEIQYIPGHGDGPDTEDTKIVDYWVTEIWCGENTAWHLEKEAIGNLDLLGLI